MVSKGQKKQKKKSRQTQLKISPNPNKGKYYIMDAKTGKVLSRPLNSQKEANNSEGLFKAKTIVIRSKPKNLKLMSASIKKRGTAKPPLSKTKPRLSKSTSLLKPGTRFIIQGHPIKVENGIFEVTATDFNKGRKNKNPYFQWRRVNKLTGEPMETNVTRNLRGDNPTKMKKHMKIIAPNSQEALKRYTEAKKKKLELDALLSKKRWELGVQKASHYDVEQVKKKLKQNEKERARLRKKAYTL